MHLQGGQIDRGTHQKAEVGMVGDDERGMFVEQDLWEN
jgi:hypothetical protein